jgi:hypothetical protein
MGVAVPPRRPWRRGALLDGALVLPRHAGAGAHDDLPDTLSRQVKIGTDAREILAALVAADDLGVSPRNSRASGCVGAGLLPHKAQCY